jgi:integrase
MQTKANGRRAYGSGSLIITKRADGTDVYYGKFRDAAGQQVKRQLGPVRTPHQADGLTKSQAEARLRDVIATVQASAPIEHARTLKAAAEAWTAHLEATGAKASTVRAYRAALTKWFLPTLGGRSLDRITEPDVEHAMGRMRAAGLSDKSVRNYVGVLRALFNFASDRRRRWATRNPTDDVELPRAPTYTEIRYLTSDEVWALVDAARPGQYQPLDRAMYLTAAMTGLRIGELQALAWRDVDFMHARIRVRRTWDRKDKTFTTPKSRRSERSVPMPDVVAGELELLLRAYQPGVVDPHPDSLVFGHPETGEPLGWRLMYERLRAALSVAGLDTGFGFHSLRHSYGTALAAQGVPMRTLQEWMGHKDIQTTQRYADYCPNPGEYDAVEAAFARGAAPGTNSSTNLPAPEGTERN